MNTDIIIQFIGYFLNPVTGIVTWVVSSRVRNNNMLNELQKTIDMLVEKNNKLINEITQLRSENAELRAGQVELKAQIERLQKTNQQAGKRAIRSASYNKKETKNL